MTQLGEEFRHREEQRQHLLRRKLEHYATLEKQLQEGLEKLHTQQKGLQEREMKVREGWGCLEGPSENRIASVQRTIQHTPNRAVSVQRQWNFKNADAFGECPD